MNKEEFVEKWMSVRKTHPDNAWAVITKRPGNPDKFAYVYQICDSYSFDGNIIHLGFQGEWVGNVYVSDVVAITEMTRKAHQKDIRSITPD